MSDKKECPHCGKDIGANFFASFKPTTMKLGLQIEDGHRLQAETIGGVLTNTSKLLKAQARQIGGEIEALVDGIAFSEKEITFTFMIVEARPKKKAARVSP